MTRQRRVYYGWALVAIFILMVGLLVGATTSSFGLFVLPVSQELHLSRAEVNSAMILLSLGIAAASPFVGYLVDRFSIRRIMMICSVIFGASLVGLGVSRNLWLSAVILAGPLSFSFTGAGNLTAPALTSRWFTINRGRALALGALGISMGAVLLSPIIAILMTDFGWRQTLVIVGSGVGAILLLCSFLVRDQPGPDDIETGAPKDAAAIARVRATLGQPRKTSELARSPILWMIAFSVALTTGLTKTLMITLVPVAQENGIPVAQAATLISATGIAAVSSKLVLAWVADKLNRTQLLAIMMAALGLVNLVLMANDSFAMLLLCSVLIGITTGVVTPVYYALVADRFGPASFGTAKGLITPVITIVGALMLRYAGEVFDRTASYDFFFGSVVVSQLVAAAMIYSTRFVQREATAATA